MLLHPQSPLVKAGYKGFVHSGQEDTFLAVKPEHVDKVPERFEPAAMEMAGRWKKEKKVKLQKVDMPAYECPKCKGHHAYGGNPETGTQFRGSGKCQDCGHLFSIVGSKNETSVPLADAVYCTSGNNAVPNDTER